MHAHLVVVLLLLVPVVSAHDPAAVYAADYVALPGDGPFVSCPADAEALPRPSPGGEWFPSHLECIPGALLFGQERDHGIRGVLVCVAGSWYGPCGDHRGDTFSIFASDKGGEDVPMRLDWHRCVGAETCTSPDHVDRIEGCGRIDSTVPEDLARHWASSPEAPGYMAVLHISTHRVDEADGAVCLGTTGKVEALF